MRLLLAAILAYAVTTTIVVCLLLAGTPAAGQEQIRFKQTPIPWRYDYPYRGKLTVIWSEPHQTHKKCGFKDKPSFIKGFAQACAFTTEDDDSACIIILPYDNGIYSKDHHAYIVRHEIAHCNGWNGEHNN